MASTRTRSTIKVGRFWYALVVFVLLATACGGSEPNGAAGEPEAPGEASPDTPTEPSGTAAETGEAWDDVVAAAEEEGAVMLYSSMPVEEGNQLIQAFSEEYPGIDVEFSRQGSSDTITKFETEVQAGRNVVDVIEHSLEEPFHDWKDRDLLLQADLPEAPELTRDEFFDPDGYWWYHGLQGYAIMYNTNNVSDDEAPQSWEDFLDSRWENRLGISPPWLGGPTLIWSYFLREELGLTDFPERFAALDPLVTSGHGDLLDAVIRGEVDAAPMLSYRIVQSRQADAPVRAFYPDEGFSVSGRVMGIAADAPHPNAGKVLTNWFLSQRGQQLLAELVGVNPLRDDVELPPEMDDYSGKNFFTFTPSEIEEARAEIVEEWERALGAG